MFLRKDGAFAPKKEMETKEKKEGLAIWQSLCILFMLVLILLIVYRANVSVTPYAHPALGIVTDISVTTGFLGTTYWVTISGAEELVSIYMPSLAYEAAHTLTHLQVGDKVFALYYNFLGFKDVINLEVLKGQ